MSVITPRQNRIAVAYKEWAGICRALGEGRQTLLLRKGGIREEGGVFRPEHSEFWLYPTHVHEAEQGLRSQGEPSSNDFAIRLEYVAKVELVAWVDQLPTVERLADLHDWTADTIHKRFAYRTPGLWVLGVRVYQTDCPWVLTPDPLHAGCKSWVPLESPPSTVGLIPVLSDAEAFERRSRLCNILDIAAPCIPNHEPRDEV